MEKNQFILGDDVSKLTLDISCASLNQHIKISNDSTGFKEFKKWAVQVGIDLKKSFIVMEYTGGYEYRLIQFCEASSINYCRLPGLEIKKSLGMTRGKNDKVDSMRIATYGEEKIKKLQPAKPLNTAILKLKQLLSFRKKIVRENAGLIANTKERKYIYNPSSCDTILKITKRKIEQNKKDIRLIEQEIMTLLQSDDAMNLNYKILTSIKGIGMINALMTIAFTENFTSFATARVYAVYVGVVPFDHSSGTSIKARRRVSCLANKQLKQELNQAAKTAIVYDPELRAYAENKLKCKPYPVVLNNVKFKLILRMFALVKRGETYIENYKKAA